MKATEGEVTPAMLAAALGVWLLAAALGVWLRMPAEKAIAHAGDKTREVMREAIAAALEAMKKRD